MDKKRKIYISESQLNNLIKHIVVEQQNVVENIEPYSCLDKEKSMAVQYTISHGVEPIFVKYALGILGRESDYVKIYGAYAKKAAPEYIMNKLSEVVPGFKSLLQWGAKTVYDKESNSVKKVETTREQVNVTNLLQTVIKDVLDWGGYDADNDFQYHGSFEGILNRWAAEDNLIDFRVPEYADWKRISDNMNSMFGDYI